MTRICATNVLRKSKLYCASLGVNKVIIVDIYYSRHSQIDLRTNAIVL